MKAASIHAVAISARVPDTIKAMPLARNTYVERGEDTNPDQVMLVVKGPEIAGYFAKPVHLQKPDDPIQHVLERQTDHRARETEDEQDRLHRRRPAYRPAERN